MANLGPFSVAYPVDFRSGGDTTKAAFGKHIQEIEKIYGILNALNADKVSASELTAKFNELSSSINDVNNNINNVQSTLTNSLNNHINSTNPHPNWKVNLGSQVTGSLSSSLISGNFDTSRINGLEDFIKNNSGGIKDISSGQNGYVRFSNGLMIQWGSGTTPEDISNFHSFPTPFSSSCYSVTATLKTEAFPYVVSRDGVLQIALHNNYNFWAGYLTVQSEQEQSADGETYQTTTSTKWSVADYSYIAIGM